MSTNNVTRAPVCLRCSRCSKEFLTQTRLTWHIRKYHYQSSESETHTDTREASKPRRPALVYALCVCPKCGGYNQIIYRYGRMLEYSKCNVCGELVPTESYQVKAYGSDGFSAVYLARLEARRKGHAERVF